MPISVLEPTTEFRPNFLDVVTSSMNNRNEYLVKYSVAPPPSRDYYGLRIVQDEVILYLWKISHGPHKTPIVHRTKFIEFGQQKLLQDEIRHGFGEHVLNHVKNITEGNENTLLTLPRHLIGRISRYLEYRDIAKLSSLSRIAYEIFNTDFVWEILYKRDKNVKISAGEKEKAEIYGWKQLYKDGEMQAFPMKVQSVQLNVTNKNKNLIKTRDKYVLQNLKTQSSIKQTNAAKTNQPLLKTTNTSKPISKTVSTVNIATKRLNDFLTADLMTTSLAETSSDTRFRGPNMTMEKEKPFSLKKYPKSFNSGSNVNEKSVKMEGLIAPKITAKRESKSISKNGRGFIRQSEKSEKYIDKINKVKTTSQEDKTKYVTSKTSSLVPESTIGNVKSSLDLARGLHDKLRSKTKAKPKKAAVTSSEIFNNDKVLSDIPFVVENSNFDLADLIEASLKNIRSPRSIFDYNFSYMQRGDTSRSRHEVLDIDRSKQLKFAQSNVVPNYFSGRKARENEILEKLSEKSEPYSETSTESIVKDVRVIPEKSDKLLSKKCRKIPMEVSKSLNARKSEEVFSKDLRDLRTNFQSKCFSPKKISNVDEKFSITRKPLRTSSLLKAHASSNSESKKSFPTKSTGIK